MCVCVCACVLHRPTSAVPAHHNSAWRWYCSLLKQGSESTNDDAVSALWYQCPTKPQAARKPVLADYGLNRHGTGLSVCVCVCVSLCAQAPFDTRDPLTDMLMDLKSINQASLELWETGKGTRTHKYTHTRAREKEFPKVLAQSMVPMRPKQCMLRVSCAHTNALRVPVWLLTAAIVNVCVCVCVCLCVCAVSPPQLHRRHQSGPGGPSLIGSLSFTGGLQRNSVGPMNNTPMTSSFSRVVRR